MSTPTAPVEILVVTALKLERLAVREHLADVRLDNRNGLAVDVGTFDITTVGGPRPHRVAVLETGPGNVDAAVLTSRAEEALRPGIVIMTGVAGGVKDVAIADVVASSKVYWLEGGKQRRTLSPRPDFAPVSGSLVQLARAVAVDGAWIERARRHGGGAWPDAGRTPQGRVKPIVVGEKVLVDERSAVADLVQQTYGDAVAVDMEDFGTLRGAHGAERARTLAIRGISDLLSGKAAADAAGSQELAAANAAAFLFELLATGADPDATVGGPRGTRRTITPKELVEVAARLYPAGPQHDALWRRASGDPARLRTESSGQGSWWHAAVLLDNGGGGPQITMAGLLAVMVEDYPHNVDLLSLIDRLRQ